MKNFRGKKISGKSKSPLIGITTYGRNESSFSLPDAYIDTVRDAGGIPVLLPPGESNLTVLIESLDGLIFAGGGDINPALYNGNAHPSNYLVDSERDAFELNLARLALDSNMPVLGICRGLQILIVVSGGTLIPHIPDEYGTLVKHRLEMEPGLRYPIEHMVQINRDSFLAHLIQKTYISVFSWHHQAVSIVPPDWRVVAHTLEDGVIEAVEHQNHPWAIGVQWHPELSANDPNHQRIFQAFIEATCSIKGLINCVQ